MGFLRKQQQDESQRTSASADTLPTADIPVDIPGIDPEKGVETYKPKLLTAWTLTMTILAAMAGFVFGYDTGQISGFLEMPVFLERFGQQHADGTYYFSNVRSGLIVGLLSIGTLIGCLIAAPLSNKFGRKWCIPPWCLVFAIGVTVQIAMSEGHWVGIAMGRWVAGLGVGSLSVLTPLYMSESSPKHVRGAVVCCYQLFVTIGIFTADCINYGTEARNDTGSYRIPMGVGYIWALILGVGMMFMPESPRFVMRQGNEVLGTQTMAKFYGVPVNHAVITLEVREVREALAAAAGNHPWYEVFTGPRMLYRVLLAMSLQTFQQLSGANYFFYYGTTVFSGVGISNSYVTSMILGGVNVASTFLGLYFVEKFGRRKCLVGGAIWMFVCFMVFASVGHFYYQPAVAGSHAARTGGGIMIAFSCLFILAFASTWGPMVWSVIGEMFPYRYRAGGISFATSANWFWNFMLAFFTPFITNDIDFMYGYVFAGCNLAAAVVVYFFLMESKGRTIEEVDSMYLMHVPVRKSASYDIASGGDLVNTDHLDLAPGGRNIRKRNAQHVEGGNGLMQDAHPNDPIVQGKHE